MRKNISKDMTVITVTPIQFPYITDRYPGEHILRYISMAAGITHIILYSSLLPDIIAFISCSISLLSCMLSAVCFTIAIRLPPLFFAITSISEKLIISSIPLLFARSVISSVTVLLILIPLHILFVSRIISCLLSYNTANSFPLLQMHSPVSILHEALTPPRKEVLQIHRKAYFFAY